jgi:hypothetical protein
VVKKSKDVIISLLFLSAGAGFIFYCIWAKKQILSTGKLTTCRIVSFSSDNKGGNGGYKCELFIANKWSIVVSPTTITRGKYDLINRYFPMIYSEKMDDGVILITPRDFKDANLPFPDSLQWIVDEGYVNR